MEDGTIIALAGGLLCALYLISEWVRKKDKLIREDVLPISAIKRMVRKGEPVPLYKVSTIPYRLRKRIRKKNPALSLQNARSYIMDGHMKWIGDMGEEQRILVEITEMEVEEMISNVRRGSSG